jgi:hypothetical protein
LSLQQDETAPLPYTSRIDGQEWFTDDTWTHSDVWDPPNSVGINGELIDWNIAQVSHNISSGSGNINLLGLLLDTPGTQLTMAEPSEPLDELNSGWGLWITHYLDLDGNIDLVGESQLVQRRYDPTQFLGSVLDENSIGYLERDQQGRLSSYNYNYWASPVSKQLSANNDPASVADVLLDGTISSTPVPIDYGGQWDWAYADGPLTYPIKLSNYWFWKFHGTDDLYDAWVHIGATGNVLTGEGYTQKGTFGGADVDDQQNYVFRGKPHNGDVTLPITAGYDRLVGNPYPSAMDADKFILDNINIIGSNRNKNIINGSIYFWDHFAGQTHILAEYVGGYATYSLIGAVQAIATDYRIKATNDKGGIRPERYIPVGQGFFVVFYDGGGDLWIRNSQRAFVREGITFPKNEGSYFFKTADTKKDDTPLNQESTEEDLRERIRLAYHSPLGYNRQLLVGIDENATDDYDIGYDAPLIENNREDMYWMIGEDKFVIQGVNNFDQNQELPIGLKVDEAGTITISLHELENMEEGTELFIKDKLVDETYLINNQPFEIDLEPGEYNDRFVLVFQPKLLTIDEISLEEGVHTYMNNVDHEITIERILDTEIVKVELFNYIGQHVKTWTQGLEPRHLRLYVRPATGAYIINVTTTHGNFSKRVIIE